MFVLVLKKRVIRFSLDGNKVCCVMEMNVLLVVVV